MAGGWDGRRRHDSDELNWFKTSPVGTLRADACRPLSRVGTKLLLKMHADGRTEGRRQFCAWLWLPLRPSHLWFHTGVG